MPETFAMAGRLDRLTGDVVELLTTDPSGDRVKGVGLCRPHRLIDLSAALAGLTDGEGAGAIRAIAVEHRAHVEDDQLAVADLMLARLGVGQRPIRAGGDDRRKGGVPPQLADAGLRGASDVALGAAAEAALQAPPPDR